MDVFSIKITKNKHYISAKNEIIGGSISPDDVTDLCYFLNNSFSPSNISFFSYDLNSDNKYNICDNHKPIVSVEAKRIAIAITNFCNVNIDQLIKILNKPPFDPIVGYDPTDDEIIAYAKKNGVGYYVALEELRKNTYKKL
jgi:hypothetical protein